MPNIPLMELSILDLEKMAIENLPTKKRQFATDPVNISTLKFIPDLKNGALKIQAVISNSGKIYDSVIFFKNVTFVDENDGVSLTADIHIKPIPFNVDVEVSCNCMDFRFRWALWNQARGALYGKPPPPYRTTSNRPPVNPKKSPGICKHLMKFSYELGNSDIIK